MINVVVTGPKSYYDKMGFIGVDQGIYTIALLGMLAGVVGTVKAGKEILLDGKSAAWLPFVTLTIGSTWAAATGLQQANE